MNQVDDTHGSEVCCFTLTAAIPLAFAMVTEKMPEFSSYFIENRISPTMIISLFSPPALLYKLSMLPELAWEKTDVTLENPHCFLNKTDSLITNKTKTYYNLTLKVNYAKNDNFWKCSHWGTI